MMTLDPNDEQLVSLATSGDNNAMEALFARYRSMMYCSARKFFIPGASAEDALQEARVGFFKGIRDFRPDAGSTFSNFAGLAVQRQLITALKTATRVKREVHNKASCSTLRTATSRGTTSRSLT
jgi:RNA polymerase sigma-H factor